MTALDSTLYYLGRNTEDTFNAFDFVMVDLSANKGKAVLLFQEVELAKTHLEHLPQKVSAQTLDDMRAKEEFLRAALQQGATQVWFDTDAHLEPQRVQPLAEALFYILSFKREAACL